MRRVFVSMALTVGLIQQIAACTLITDPFRPEPVVGDRSSDAGGSATLPGSNVSDRPDASVGLGCVGTSELPGCELPLTPPGECESDLDCQSQVCAMGRCAAPSCSDGRQNGDEAGVDCGPVCGASCASQSCDGGACQEASCEDGIRNGGEAAADCGAVCGEGCLAGTPCEQGADCASRVCGDDGRCAAPTCDDDVQNQDETAADCGGACPNDCAVGQACAFATDCQTGVCAASGCGASVERCCQPPSCNDGVRNGTEPVIDCGNPACGLCPQGRACTGGSQCASGFCDAGFCRTPSCTDEALNGTESDVDCGGACGACAPGLACDTDADCQSAVCQDGRCCGGREQDCTRCARRLVSRLTCELNADAVAADNCNAFLDCLADNPSACPIRHAGGCSDDPGGVCNHTAFGGNGEPGLARADSILGTASCFF